MQKEKERKNGLTMQYGGEEPREKTEQSTASTPPS